MLDNENHDDTTNPDKPAHRLVGPWRLEKQVGHPTDMMNRLQMIMERYSLSLADAMKLIELCQAEEEQYILQAAAITYIEAMAEVNANLDRLRESTDGIWATLDSD